MIISVRIDVTKIDKAKLYVGEKGTYLDVTLLLKDDQQADSYGNHGMVVQSVTKEERQAGKKGPILGNAKIIGGSKNNESNPGVDLPVSNDLPTDLPF